MIYKTKAVTLFVTMLFTTAMLQQVQATEIVYPAKGQSEKQQNKDKFECHEWATGQTGVDPEKMLQQTYNVQSQPEEEPTGLFKRIRMRKQLKEKQQYVSDQLANDKAQLKRYDSAYGTCLRGRGYTVSWE